MNNTLLKALIAASLSIWLACAKTSDESETEETKTEGAAKTSDEAKERFKSAADQAKQVSEMSYQLIGDMSNPKSDFYVKADSHKDVLVDFATKHPEIFRLVKQRMDDFFHSRNISSSKNESSAGLRLADEIVAKPIEAEDFKACLTEKRFHGKASPLIAEKLNLADAGGQAEPWAPDQPCPDNCVCSAARASASAVSVAFGYGYGYAQCSDGTTVTATASAVAYAYAQATAYAFAYACLEEPPKCEEDGDGDDEENPCVGGDSNVNPLDEVINEHGGCFGVQGLECTLVEEEETEGSSEGGENSGDDSSQGSGDDSPSSNPPKDEGLDNSSDSSIR